MRKKSSRSRPARHSPEASSFPYNQPQRHPAPAETIMLKYMTVLTAAGAVALGAATATADAQFGPSNPFYAPSTLPFHAPPFDKIKDGDYQPAIEAGMAEQIKEIEPIANKPAAPTFEN